MDWIWQSFARQWLAVTEAPFLYLAAATGVAFMAWIVANLYYRASLSSKDASLSSKDAEIALLVRERDAYKQQASDVANKRVGPNTDVNGLEICLPGVQEAGQILADGRRVRHVVRVLVRNRGDGFLTDCKLVIKECAPIQTSGQIPAALAYNFGISEDHHFPVSVAWWDDQKPFSPEDDRISDVMIAVPVFGGFFRGWTSVKADSKENASIITLEATSLETNPCIEKFRLWVSSDRRLNLEKI